ARIRFIAAARRHGTCTYACAMPLFKALLLLQVFLFASLPEAHAKSCEERDFSGLNLQVLPSAYGEAVCQLKILLLRRTSHDSLKRFLVVHGDQIGISHNDLNMA